MSKFRMTCFIWPIFIYKKPLVTRLRRMVFLITLFLKHAGHRGCYLPIYYYSVMYEGYLSNVKRMLNEYSINHLRLPLLEPSDGRIRDVGHLIPAKSDGFRYHFPDLPETLIWVYILEIWDNFWMRVEALAKPVLNHANTNNYLSLSLRNIYKWPCDPGCWHGWSHF